MKVTLTVTDGPHQGQVFEFDKHDAFIVGRSDDALFRLPLKDKTLSRVHFMLEVNPPRCRLLDMASTNGTKVNALRVTQAELKDGDVIRAGKSVLTVAIGPPDQPELPGSVFREEDTDPMLGMAPGSSPAPSQYRIERELGRGGMGVVYLAHGADGEPVALKTITPAVADSGGAMQRFLREASVLRKLNHPNIVRFREIIAEAGHLYFVMDYVPGIDAKGLVHRDGPLPVTRSAGLACQALDGLAHAHARGFVHRDVKPANLLVGEPGVRDVLKLADFGLARIYQDSPLSGLTLTGQFSGTSGFMAPEQITDYRSARPPVDLYAAGATLYYLLTGRTIYDFPGGVERQLLMILQDEPVPILKRRPDLPKKLSAIVHKALARDPTARFLDAAAMRKALSPFATASSK